MVLSGFENTNPFKFVPQKREVRSAKAKKKRIRVGSSFRKTKEQVPVLAQVRSAKAAKRPVPPPYAAPFFRVTAFQNKLF
jgi:hypothetical protein